MVRLWDSLLKLQGLGFRDVPGSAPGREPKISYEGMAPGASVCRIVHLFEGQGVATLLMFGVSMKGNHRVKQNVVSVCIFAERKNTHVNEGKLFPQNKKYTTTPTIM